MKRGTPMKRTPFKSKRPVHQPAVEREPRPMATFVHAKPLSRGTYVGALPGIEQPKENVVRSEAYRRLVAALPCSWCEREVPCQAAHPNHGKGMAIKTDDRRCFPLCPSCHADFDQGTTATRDAKRMLADVWGELARKAILSAGKWPAGLPRWKEEA